MYIKPVLLELGEATTLIQGTFGIWVENIVSLSSFYPMLPCIDGGFMTVTWDCLDITGGDFATADNSGVQRGGGAA